MSCFLQPYLRVRAVVVKHVHLDFLCRGGRRPGHPFLYHWFQPQERCVVFHWLCSTGSFSSRSLSKHVCFRLNRYTVWGYYRDRITLPARAVSTLTHSLSSSLLPLLGGVATPRPFSACQSIRRVFGAVSWNRYTSPHPYIQHTLGVDSENARSETGYWIHKNILILYAVLCKSRQPIFGQILWHR